MGEMIEGFVGSSFMQEQQRQAILDLIPLQGKFLELGTGHGVTVAWWASQRPEVLFTSVDAFKVGTGTGAGNEGHWRQNHKKNQELFVGTSTAFVAHVKAAKEHTIGIVFIDGSHGYWDCLTDLGQLECLVASRGKLLVHDYGHPHPPLRHVRRAVDAFCALGRWYKTGLAYRTAILERRR